MFWKPLLIIAPAGLMLGTIGGQMAKPVMLQRTGDDPVQAMFQSRANLYGHANSYPAQTEGPMTYDGGYSYAPDYADTAAGWTAPDYYHFADVPLPTSAQLDAHDAALLADPEVQYRSYPAETLASETEETTSPVQDGWQPGVEPSASGSGQVALAPEPRTDDGALPAIW
jgi:hypothetical protein